MDDTAASQHDWGFPERRRMSAGSHPDGIASVGVTLPPKGVRTVPVRRAGVGTSNEAGLPAPTPSFGAMICLAETALRLVRTGSAPITRRAFPRVRNSSVSRSVLLSCWHVPLFFRPSSQHSRSLFSANHFLVNAPSPPCMRS